MTSEFLYDLSREMRRRAIAGSLGSTYPRSAHLIEEALESGHRVLFDVEDELIFVETPVDRVFYDRKTGRPIGARQL